MKLSNFERLSLLNQFTILSKLEEDEYDKDSYDRNIKILREGFEYDYDFIDTDSIPEEVSKFVSDVLQMYRVLHFWEKDNSGNDDLLNNSFFKFQGFDGNHEAKYLIYTDFLLEDKGLFQELHHEKHDYNSHGRNGVVPVYRSMLSSWNNNYDMNRNDINNILKAANDSWIEFYSR